MSSTVSDVETFDALSGDEQHTDESGQESEQESHRHGHRRASSVSNFDTSDSDLSDEFDEEPESKHREMTRPSHQHQPVVVEFPPPPPLPHQHTHHKPKHEHKGVQWTRKAHGIWHNGHARGRTVTHHSASGSLSHHDVHPTHHGRHHSDDYGIDGEEHVVITDNGFLKSIANSHTGRRTLFSIPSFSQAKVVVHEVNGHSVDLMLSPTTLKSLHRILKSHGQGIFTGKDLRLDTNGHFTNPMTQNYIASVLRVSPSVITIFSYLGYFGLELVSHDSVSSDTREFQRLDSQATFTLVIEHSRSDKKSYPIDPTTMRPAVHNLQTTGDVYDQTHYDDLIGESMHVVPSSYTPPNALAHNSSVSNYHELRSAVQGNLERYQVMAKKGLVAEIPEHLILQNWDTHYMTHFESFTKTDGKLRPLYNNMKSLIKTHQQNGKTAGETLVDIHDMIEKTGDGFLHHLWNKFQVSHVHAICKVFHAALGELADQVEEAIKNGTVSDQAASKPKPAELEEPDLHISKEDAENIMRALIEEFGTEGLSFGKSYKKHEEEEEEDEEAENEEGTAGLDPKGTPSAGKATHKHKSTEKESFKEEVVEEAHKIKDDVAEEAHKIKDEAEKVAHGVAHGLKGLFKRSEDAVKKLTSGWYHNKFNPEEASIVAKNVFRAARDFKDKSPEMLEKLQTLQNMQDKLNAVKEG